MDSSYSRRFSKKASADLDDIIRYIAIELSNPDAASVFIDKLLSVIDEACMFPQSGTPAATEVFPDAGIRKKPVGNYVIYYLPDNSNNAVVILRILYSRRNLNEILAELTI